MKILILSANTGEGHNSAARAIQEALLARGAECVIHDGLSFMSAATRKLICEGHVFMYRRLPKVYGVGYRFSEIYARQQRYQRQLNRESARRHLPRRERDLRRYLESGGFGAIICVHVFAARFVSELRKHGDISLPAYFLATDYTCSPGVNQLDMDAWFIPHAQLIDEFAAFGIPGEKLIPTGIPIRRDFMQRGDKAAARRALGLPADKKIALVSCGSMGAGSMGAMVVDMMETLPPNALLVAVCGSNQALQRSLTAQVHSKQLYVLGYTQRMGDYLDACDLFITKPGGLSTTEAVHKRVPLMLIDTAPGCETRNLKFLTGLGCALSAPNAAALAERVRSALASEDTLSALSESCARQFTENAAERICDTVLDVYMAERTSI